MKVWNYVLISIGMILLLEMGGIPTGASGVLEFVGLSTNSADVNISGFYDAVLLMLAAGLGGGIIIGFFTRTSPENFIILPFIISTVVLFAGTFVSVLSYALGNYAGWVSGILLLLLGPFSVGFIFALIEFFRGTD